MKFKEVGQILIELSNNQCYKNLLEFRIAEAYVAKKEGEI